MGWGGGGGLGRGWAWAGTLLETVLEGIAVTIANDEIGPGTLGRGTGRLSAQTLA